MKRHDVSCLKYLFLAGEPLDEPTARWASESLGVAIVDNYWQTETGWPILSAQPGVEETPRKFGSPSFAVYGYDVRLLREGSGEEAGADEKAVLTITPPRSGRRSCAGSRSCPSLRSLPTCKIPSTSF